MPNKGRTSKRKSDQAIYEVQKTFFSAISRPLLVDDRMPPDKSATALIRPSKHHSAHTRLQYYAQQYWWRLLDAFDDDFTTLKKVLSSEQYGELKLSYLSKCPSRSFTLRNLGLRLPEFLSKWKVQPKFPKQLALDAARYDWARIEAFDGSQFKSITMTDVVSKGFERRKIQLQPHVRLLELRYPVWKVSLNDLRESEVVSSSGLRKRSRVSKHRQLKLPESKVYVAVHRFENVTHCKTLHPGEFKVLRMLSEGCSLLEVVSGLPKRLANDQNLIQGLFAQCMALKWLYYTQPRSFLTKNERE